MKFAETPVPFPVYYILNFYSDFVKAAKSQAFSTEHLELIQKFVQKLIHYDDVMIPVEELAAVHSATELTIFISDLIERSTEQEYSDLLETSSDLANDLCDLFLLMTEEEGFVEGLEEFVADVQLDAQVVESQDSLTETASEEVIQEELAPATEKTEHETPNIHLDEALETTILASLSTFDEDRIALISSLFSQLDRKKELTNLLIPSELNNLIQLLDEAKSSAGKELFQQNELIKTNLKNLDDQFIQDLKAKQFNILHAMEEENLVAKESSPEPKKKSKTKIKQKIDAEVKGKLRAYFINEANEHFDLIQNVIESFEIHNLAPNKFQDLYEHFTSLKDMSIIHGYDGIEFISSELAQLFKEAIRDNLVFTSDSVSLFNTVIASSKDLLAANESKTEQTFVNSIIDEINNFNRSLAILELSKEELFHLKDEDVQEKLKAILKEKLNKTSLNPNRLVALSSDFLLVQDSIHNQFSLKLAALEDELLNEKNDEIKLLLSNDIFQEDIDLFFSELEEKEDHSASEEMNSENFSEETTERTSEEVTIDHSEEKSFEELVHDAENEKKKGDQHSFDDILKNAQIYETILSKKLFRLKHFFEKNDAESIIILSSLLELETKWLNYPQLADFFSFYSLNLDHYIDSQEKKEKIYSEFIEISKNPSKYEFHADQFTESGDENETSDTVEEGEEWVHSVADVLENTTIEAEKSTSSIEIKAIFEGVDTEIKDIFSDEAGSYIETINRQLDILSRNNNDRDAITLAEKAAHTLKGASMMLNIATIGDIAERIEHIFEHANMHENPVEEAKLTEIQQFISIINELLKNNIDAAKQKLAEINIQVETLADTVEDDDEDIEMLEIFQEESNENVEQIEQALAQVSSDLSDLSSFKRVESNALSLKSAAKMLGFKRIGILAETIEQHAELINQEAQKTNEAQLSAFLDILQHIKELSLGHEVSADVFDVSIQEIKHQFNETEQIASEHSNDVSEESISELFLDESIEIITDLSDRIDTLKENGPEKGVLRSIASLFFQLQSSASTASFKQVSALAEFGEELANSLSKEKDLDVPKAISKLSSAVSELVKVSKHIEENDTDDLESLKSFLSSLQSHSEKDAEKSESESIVSDSTEMIDKRSQLSNKLDSLKSLIASFEDESDEKSDRRVIQKNIDQVIAQVDEIKKSMDEVKNNMDDNKEQLKEVLEDSPENTDQKSYYVIELKDERYAFSSEHIASTYDVKLTDTFIKGDSSYVYLDDKEYELFSLHSILGIDLSLPEEFVVIRLAINDSIYALSIPKAGKEFQLEIRPGDESDRKQMCDGTAFDSKKRLIFILNSNFIRNKIEARSFAPEKESKVNKITKKSFAKGKATALVADDSLSIRRFLGDVLGLIGFNTVLANDGADALSKADESNFDLIITDLEMPNMDGFQFIEEIRNRDAYSQVPLIVLTGRSGEKDKDKAILKGANSYILKPFKELELKQKLSEFFDIKS